MYRLTLNHIKDGVEPTFHIVLGKTKQSGKEIKTLPSQSNCEHMIYRNNHGKMRGIYRFQLQMTTMPGINLAIRNSTGKI